MAVRTARLTELLTRMRSTAPEATSPASSPVSASVMATLSPAGRMKTIWPRFLDHIELAGRQGLQHRHEAGVAGRGKLRDDGGTVGKAAFGKLVHQFLDRLGAGGKNGD